MVRFQPLFLHIFFSVLSFSFLGLQDTNVGLKKVIPYVPKACFSPHCFFCLFYGLDNFHCSYFNSLDFDLISYSLTPTYPSLFYYGAHQLIFISYSILSILQYYLHLVIFLQFYFSFLLRTPIFPFISRVFTLCFMII